MKTARMFTNGLRASLAAFAFLFAGLDGKRVYADSAFAWGQNDAGELGNGSYSASYPFGNQSSPAPVMVLTSGVTAVAAGAESSLAIQNGAVYAWGSDAYGQLGIASYYTYPYHSLIPVAVTNLASGVTAASAGDFHCLAIQNGGAYAWGDNSYGELGNGSTNTSLTAVPVTNLSTGVTAIAAGRYYSLALQKGIVYSWGANWHGQLGNGTTSITPNPIPEPVSGLSSGVTAIATSGLDDTGSNSSGGTDGTYYSHSLALQNGAVYAWGSNAYGQLGNGTTTNSLAPVAVTNLSSGVTSIAAGSRFSLAARNGNVYAWGSGFLGDGTTNPELVPELIDPSVLTNITTVDATDISSFALSADGSLWVWGDNSVNELGLGSGSSYEYLTPQHLLPPPGYRFTSISDQADGDSVLATLAPVPEPATVTLLAIGSLALLSRRKRFQ